MLCRLPCRGNGHKGAAVGQGRTLLAFFDLFSKAADKERRAILTMLEEYADEKLLTIQSDIANSVYATDCKMTADARLNTWADEHLSVATIVS